MTIGTVVAVMVTVVTIKIVAKKTVTTQVTRSCQHQDKTFRLQHARGTNVVVAKEPNERNEQSQGRLPGRRLPIRRCGPPGAEIIGLQRPGAARVPGSNSSSGAACRRLHSHAVEACRLRRLAAGGGRLGRVKPTTSSAVGLTGLLVPEWSQF